MYRTHDDSHIWLTKFIPNKKIIFLFKSQITLALIRIWNYNKSRIYSNRGVKLIVIKLGDNIIFEGEIAKASGELIAPPEAFGDVS